MSEVVDLFDYAQATKAKQEGMARSEANAEPTWADHMLAFVQEIARTHRLFTADDVFELAYEAGVYDGTHDRRAFGPVMLRAAKAGWCQKADCAPRNSNRRSLHGSPRAVWQSLIMDH